MPRQRLFIAAFALLAGCAQTPGEPPQAGLRLPENALFSVPVGTEPVATSVQIAASYLADPPRRLSGRPALAAQTLAQYEFATVGLGDLRFVALSPLTQILMAQGRVALRTAVGISTDAPPALVIESLTAAAGALQRGDSAAAEAALARLPLTRSPAEVLATLHALPYVPEANWAASFAASELARPRDNRFLRRGLHVGALAFVRADP